jgi:peptidoglycan/xylan/chitin deacetylase (PgdA/CDA1 family)
MSRAVILMYHSVGDHERDPWYLRVDAEHFDEQIRLLREQFRPATLRDIAAEARSGSITPGSVAVTFDDGYANNLTDAAPILERHDVPATVFVATGFVAHQRSYWWEQLEELFLGPGRLPANLEVALDGVSHKWSLGLDAARATPTDQERGWRCNEPPPSSRHASFLALADLLKRVSPTTREAAIAELTSWAARPVFLRQSRQPVTTEQLTRLGRHELVEIGAHTVWHPWLPLLRPDEQRAEIIGSKEWLQQFLGEEILTFAYPDGAHHTETKAVVAEGGFEGACTTTRGPVTAAADPLAMPRLAVHDWPAEVLEQKLNSLMRG